MLSPQDITVILVIAFFLFGAKKLPDIGKDLGKGIRAFKDGLDGTKEEEKKKELLSQATEPKAASDSNATEKVPESVPEMKKVEEAKNTTEKTPA